MPLSKKKNRNRMRIARATCVQPDVVQPEPPIIPSVFDPTIPFKHKISDKQETLKHLRGLMSAKSSPVSEDMSAKIPLYNPAVHRPGDTVMIRNPHTRKMVETVIPKIDADGNAVPDY